MTPPIYKFCDWVDQEQVTKTYGFGLCANSHPALRSYYKLYPKRIHYYYISANESDWVGEVFHDNNHMIDNLDDGSWRNLVRNESDWAGKLLRAKIGWNPSESRALYPDKIDWKELCHNRSNWAKELLQANPNKIDWKELSYNNSDWANKWLQDLINWNPSDPCKLDNLNKLCWFGLVYNNSEWVGKLMVNNCLQWLLNCGISARTYQSKWGAALLQNNPSKINWPWLCALETDWAEELLLANPDKIVWNRLALNPSKWVEKLILNNLDKINWNLLSTNEAEWVGKLFQSNPDRINDIDLERLPNNHSEWAGKLLQDNPDQIKWRYAAARNPIIFTYDYEQMRMNNINFQEELIQAVYHPIRVAKYLETNEDIDMYLQ